MRFTDVTAIIAKTQEELQDMVTLETTNIDKSQIMRVTRSIESFQIKLNIRELKKQDPHANIWAQ